MKNICLLDLNYTLVGNQADTRLLRPFARRMAAEEYRADLIEAIRDDYVIIVTARPDYQMRQTMENIKKKTGWQPNGTSMTSTVSRRCSRNVPSKTGFSPSMVSRTARREPTTTPSRATLRRGRCTNATASRLLPTICS